MSDLILADIVTQCLDLEKKAIRVYDKLREQAKKEDLKTFWSEMCTQEGLHVRYWQGLLDMVKERKIPDVFDRPMDVLDELNAVEKKVDLILEKDMDLSEPASAFLTAYSVETFLLHPAFETMFFLMTKLTGDSSPEDNYRGHIQALIETMRKQGQNRPEFELIAELTDQLWERNQRLARQMVDIKQLRGLLPICMHCKKIRNEKGYWQKVEDYIGDHSEAVFSHGICYECIEKYHPEIYQDLKISKSKKD
jgi:rubrerythrin